MCYMIKAEKEGFTPSATVANSFVSSTSGTEPETTFTSILSGERQRLGANVIMQDRQRSILSRIITNSSFINNNNNQNYHHHPQSNHIKKDSATRGKEEEKCVAFVEVVAEG